MDKEKSPIPSKSIRDDLELRKMIDERAREVVQNYLKSGSFTERKITDTPTDALSVVNRNYVTNNGASSLRPTSSVIGQPYFDTSISKPIWWNGTNFQDAAGNSV